MTVLERILVTARCHDYTPTVAKMFPSSERTMPTRVENCFKALPTDLVGMGSRVKVIPVNLSLNFFAIHREAADYPSSYPIRIDSEAKSDEDCLEN